MRCMCCGNMLGGQVNIYVFWPTVQFQNLKLRQTVSVNEFNRNLTPITRPQLTPRVKPLQPLVLAPQDFVAQLVD